VRYKERRALTRSGDRLTGGDALAPNHGAAFVRPSYWGIERRPNCEGAHTKKAWPAEEPRRTSLPRVTEETSKLVRMIVRGQRYNQSTPRLQELGRAVISDS
jgi:hypothetical protein